MMSDFEAVYGEFKATNCEWIGNEDERCSEDCLSGKSYCYTHYRKVFKVVTDEKFEENVVKDLENADTIESDGEEEW